MDNKELAKKVYTIYSENMYPTGDTICFAGLSEYQQNIWNKIAEQVLKLEDGNRWFYKVLNGSWNYRGINCELRGVINYFDEKNYYFSFYWDDKIELSGCLDDLEEAKNVIEKLVRNYKKNE